MRHFFRINTHNQGYILFSSSRSGDILENPLDTVSGDVPRAYLSTQNRIDAVLDAPIARWSLSILSGDASHPIVTYGSKLSARDSRGRTGISFIHGIEGDSPQDILPLVKGVINMLSPSSTLTISALVQQVAIGEKSYQDLIIFAQNSIQKYCEDFSSYSAFGLSTPIKEIIHDCGGASSIAWLAMIISHHSQSRVWEVYDEYRIESQVVSTKSSHPSASRTIKLSDYIHTAITTNEIMASLHSRPLGKGDSFTTNRPSGQVLVPLDVFTPAQTNVYHSTSPGQPNSQSATNFTQSPGQQNQNASKSPELNWQQAIYLGASSERFYLNINNRQKRFKLSEIFSLEEDASGFRISVYYYKFGLFGSEERFYLDKSQLEFSQKQELSDIRNNVKKHP